MPLLLCTLLGSVGPVLGAGTEGGVTFTDIAAGAGIDYQRTPSPRIAVRDAIDASSPIAVALFAGVQELSPQKERGLPGVALVDYDGDGDLDIYVTNGPGSNNSLYQNQLQQTGSLVFVDVAVAAGVAATSQDSSGVCFGDIDNDGDDDLYVLGVGGANILFRNEGDGTFTDITASAGVGGLGRHASGCTMADVDGDGLLDIFVTNTYDDWNHRRPFFGDLFYYGGMEHNQLFINRGGNVFTEESASRGLQTLAGLAPDASLSWAAAAIDYDEDGDVDLMTADTQGNMTRTDTGYTRLFENDGTGFFTDATLLRGLAQAGSWQGLAFGDYDCDGHLDFFATNAGRYVGGPEKSSRWFLGSASGTFSDPGVGTLENGGLGGTPFGWGASTLDFDNDGDQDLVWYGGDDLVRFISSDNPGTLIRNDGSCTARFRWQADALLADHRLRQVHGAATGDLNRDGFPDIVSAASFRYEPHRSFPWTSFGTIFDPVARIENVYVSGSPPGFLTFARPAITNGDLAIEINSGGNGNRAVEISLVGAKGITPRGRNNRDGIGAVIRFTPEGGKPVLHPVVGGASHASQDALAATFGFGDAVRGILEVFWQGPEGPVKNRLYDVLPGERLRIPEIPCSFETALPRQEYRDCVRAALKDFRHPGIELLSADEARRLEESALRARGIGSVDPSNPANPFDFAGQLHNEGLDYLIGQKHRLATNGVLIRDNAVRILAEKLCADGFASSGAGASIDACIERGFKNLTSVMDVARLPLSSFYESTRLKDPEINTLNAIGAQIDLAFDEAGLGPAAALENIRAIEAGILREHGQAGVTDKESPSYRAMLIGSSVARFSIAYWHDQSSREESPWSNPLGGPAGPVAGKYNDDEASWADFKGAVGGAITGFLFGGGPFGSVIGVVTGSITSSVDNIGVQLGWWH